MVIKYEFMFEAILAEALKWKLYSTPAQPDRIAQW